MKKLPFLILGMSFATFSFSADEAVMAKYQQSCSICHSVGAAGAPKTGSAEEWAPRLEKGMDTLVASVTNGLNAMPPKGMCNDCSADDYKAMIEYMSTPQ
jgi:cytochrome c5